MHELGFRYAKVNGNKKGDMQKWFKDKKNPFDGKMKKTELYEIIKLKKPEPVHKQMNCYVGMVMML